MTDAHSCLRSLGVASRDCDRIFVDGANRQEERDDGRVHSLNVPLAK